MNKNIHILQISDTHLFCNSEGTLLSLNTRQTFDAVIKMIYEESVPIDMIILTGDLSHDGTSESYQYLADKLKLFNCPIYWLPGNHDVLDPMEKTLSNTQLKSDKEIIFENWHLLLLNSLVPKQASGLLGDKELNKVERFINNPKQDHQLIFLHHQPIPVGSNWLDGVGLLNGSAFLSLIKKAARLRGVIFGHVHQSFDETQDNLHFISAPSTSIQFLPKSYNFALDKIAPGYQYIELTSDGTIQATVKRLKNFESNIDFSAKGY